MKITLEQMLESLSHDTLSFMADSNHANGTVSADQIPKVVSRINSVLRRLSVRFVLNEKFVYVNVAANRRYYPMTAGSAWIVSDPEEPFTGDVGRILGIETPSGRMHDLGDKATHNSILLRDDGQSFALDTLLSSGQYKVIYKAATPQFKTDGSDLKQELSIPEALLNALYMGVAAITYEGIGGPDNLAMARDKWAHYEKECSEARVNSAVEVEENDDGNKFRDKGFH
jgi:hypothetical protein